MWSESIWNIPMYLWLLLIVLAFGMILIAFLRNHSKPDPVKECMDYYCRCYARGDISKDDFEELKKDLQEFEERLKKRIS